MMKRWDKALYPVLVLTICLSAANTSDVKGSASCPHLAECAPRSVPCKTNADCLSEEVCCSSPCGRVCTQQLFTGCQQLERAARRRAKSLGSEGKAVRIPRCTKSGDFEQIQCDNEIVSSCWCVDKEGLESPGTRAPAVGLVNCTAPKDCAAHTCRMFCTHGFALAPNGCPLCRCRDPCDDVKCPNSLSCQLEEVDCSNPPCPPIPSCKRGRSLEDYCPIGDPLKIVESGLPFLCGNDPGKPTCPPMFQCLVKNGHDYGVCCPASLSIQKAGQCPVAEREDVECGDSCQHDLECHSVQKCCESEQCGKHCVHPQNLTECIHQRKLADILSVNERTGKGYIPQCSEDGQFEPKQCSRNGLVCWCVDKAGNKLKGSMGAAGNVSCSVVEVRDKSSGRSIGSNGKDCKKLVECAAVCEYGFKVDENGCPSCKCDEPCEGYTCQQDEECVVVKDASCTDFLCPSIPMCRPKMLYNNPCDIGTPLTDESGSPVVCEQSGKMCPSLFTCTNITGTHKSVCCPMVPIQDQQGENSSQNVDYDRQQTMCEYLRDFSESMEGTREGMSLALPPPKCDDKDGTYIAQQCYKNECWCVDHFGTEIPRTRGKGKPSDDCDKLRSSLECLDLTCRMGCEYGFDLDEKTRCPKCQCKDPCSGIACGESEQCQLVEVSCKDYYCPPVPACLPKKTGQCPYLVPTSSPTCDYECNSDLACNGTSKCCSNGCGTQCVEPLQLTACQHDRAVAQHQAHESGTPAGKVFIPECKPDGSYDPLQCNPGTRECWCVDFRGFELSSSRRPKTQKVTCNPPPPSSNCPLYKCQEDCEHGFEIDEHGCRTCECVAPCKRIACKGEGESCRLVQVQCVTWPCPPVPMCLPKRENPCHFGTALQLGDEQVPCGPNYDSCPTSHKCQLSPLGEYALCCPKPRDVCFEPKDEGSCAGRDPAANVTRWHFSPKGNACEPFAYTGCRGNHNNFQTEQMCNRVCPVLSQCERLREKNQKVADKYSKPTFAPRCEPDTGAWQPVQCLEHVGVCWCVSPLGEPMKGTLTRGAEPDCNFRQARRKSDSEESDIVFEEIIMQIGAIEEPIEMEGTENDLVYWEQPVKTRCQSLGAQCDSQGRFSPKQCDDSMCWCVDDAGHQLPQTNTFKDGEKICLPTPIETVEVVIGLRGEFDQGAIEKVIKQIKTIVVSLKGTIAKDEVNAEFTSDALYIQFSLEGDNKVDVAFHLEGMVTDQNIPNLTADITRSQFVHRLGSIESTGNHMITLQQREILSQSPVPLVAPYPTAVVVISAASAFVISVLTLLIILYKKKVSNMHNITNQKEVDNKEHFLVYNTPVYIELPKDNQTSDNTNVSTLSTEKV